MIKILPPSRDRRPAAGCLVFILAMSVLSRTGWAALERPGPAREFTLKAVGRDFLQDAGRIWSYPADIQARDVFPLVTLAAATGVLVANDESIYRSFKNFQAGHPWVDDASPVLTQMGTTGALGVTGIFLGAGLLFKDHRARDTGLLAAEAVIQSALVVQLMKSLTGRWRPMVAEGADHWEGPAVFFKRMGKGEESRYDAFPSGHTAAAFSVATVVALQYRKTVWIPVLAYTLAAATGLSRLTEDKHWMSDVVIGSVLGHVIARLIIRNHRRRYHVLPVVTAGKGALSLGLSCGLS